MKSALLIQFDIETLSLHPTHAVIGEIGVDITLVTCNDYGQIASTSESAAFKLDMESQVAAGRKLDISTIQWWLKQSDMAREAMADAQGRRSIQTTIAELDAFIRPVIDTARAEGSAVFVMASAVGLDLTNIRQLYQDAGFDLPWYHWEEHSQRTLRQFAPKRERTNGTDHTAQGDAAWQNHVLFLGMVESEALRKFFKLGDCHE